MDTYQMTNVDFHRCKYIHEYIISKPAKCNLLLCMFKWKREREKERDLIPLFIFLLFSVIIIIGSLASSNEALWDIEWFGKK